MFKQFIVFFCAVCICVQGAHAQPPLEAYGKLPTYRSVAVSPSGERVAYLRRQGELEFAGVHDFSVNAIMGAIDIKDIKTRSVFFLSDEYAILRASETASLVGYRGEFEYSAAFSWNLKTKKVRQLLRGSDDLYPAQSGLGRIVGKLDGTTDVFMPAYVGSGTADPVFGLMKVDLKNGRGRVYQRGSEHTIDWLVDTDGQIIAREDFNDDRDEYVIYTYDGRSRRKIYEDKDASLLPFSLLGYTSDRRALVVRIGYKGEDRRVLATMSFDGKLSEPIFEREDADIKRVLADTNRVVYGVEYSGTTPSYEFFDKKLTELVTAAQAQFPTASVTLTDWSDDFKHLILHVAGGDLSPSFLFFDIAENTLSRIAQEYEEIPADQVGQVYTIEYRARDGHKIPSILTIPPGAELKEKHPTIIMPHGGPETYDAVGFDWLAQFFANRGYAVLQPNFRGSDGFGSAFRIAGHGEWGRGVMQHDITDGVGAMIRAEFSDPDRICIIGASYGGYAALAGGAFTPELYKCVAAIAPVADLPRMLIDERRDSGKDSWVYTYWTNLVGDLKEERERLKNISPSEFADQFQAPVLLIHGNDDTVVPYRQSAIMNRALERAGKNVELIKIKGGDHWLSTSETRLDTLKALDGFVQEHLGTDQ